MIFDFLIIAAVTIFVEFPRRYENLAIARVGYRTGEDITGPNQNTEFGAT